MKMKSIELLKKNLRIQFYRLGELRRKKKFIETENLLL